MAIQRQDTPWGEATEEAGEIRAVTVRAVIAAVLVIAISVLWDEWMTYYMAGSNISRSHFPLAFFFPFLGLAVLNMAVRKIQSRWALTRPELLVVLGMGLVAIAVPYDGITGHLISVLAGVYYFATPENGWEFYLHENVPAWLAPSNAGGAMGWFFEGMPVEGQFPALSVWIVPLFWWTCIIGAMAFAVFCMVVMLRKQWTENERLTYPLVQVGQVMTETEAGGQLSQMLRSPLFWIACGLVMVLKMWNVGSYFTPAFPRIPMEAGQFRFYPDFPFLIRRVSFYAIGFGYFARLDVLFSMWSFVFLAAFEVFFFNKLGYTAGAAERQWQSPALAWQSLGALLFLAVWSLWMARGHLKGVWRKAMNPGDEVDDSRELLSYRTAVFGLIGSMVFAAAWLVAAGMEFWVVLTFLPVSLLTFLGLSRVIAELGLVYVYYQVQPYNAVLELFGTPMIGPSSVTALAFMRTFSSIGKGFVMPAFSQSVRAVDRVVKPRRIAVVLWVALAVGFVISVSNTLYLGYAHGAYNLGNMGLRKAAPQTFDAAITAIRNPIPLWGINGVTRWALIGAAAMAGLTLVRYWVPWWPLHPVGLAIQGNYGVTKTVFSLLIVWAAKSIIMNIGGVKLYEKGKPFFLGLLAAQAISTAIVFSVDWIWFPMRGHNVHNF